MGDDMIRVLVVDDHPVYRQGIAGLLAASGYEVVAEVGSAAKQSAGLVAPRRTR